MSNPVWSGVEIDFAALANYGWYKSQVTVNGVPYPRLSGYQVAGLAEMDARIAAGQAAIASAITTIGSTLRGSSATANQTIGTGAKTFTIETGKAVGAADRLLFSDAAAPGLNWVILRVTAYNAGTGALAGTVDASTDLRGSGTPASWIWNITGLRGETGSAGTPASEATAGVAEIATQSEADAGTDDTRMMTPLKTENSPAGVGTTLALIHANE